MGVHGHAIDVNIDYFPLIISRFGENQGLQDVEYFIERMNLVHMRKKPWASICYFSSYSKDPALHQRVASWTRQTEPHVSAYCMGVAMISRSIGFRFVLGSVFLLKKLPCPHDVCSNFDDALSFLQKQASARGYMLPAVRRPWPDIP